MRARAVCWACLVIIGCAAWPPAAAHAQQGLSAAADVIFYGDNTEFRNAFSEGETIFGTAARGEARIELGNGVQLNAGVFVNQRFGSDSAFELVRPVLALSVRGRRSTFIFGTLDTPRAATPPGPDRAGPHRLLPPIQRARLAFDRPYEAGLQWLFQGARLEHDLWLHWQRVNTAEHRERLDGGARLQWRLAHALALPLQVHIVHEGGQLYGAGPVRDSVAVATGIVLSKTAQPEEPAAPAASDRVARMTGTLELLALWSHHVPDRQQPQRTRDGAAFFGQTAVEWPAWRAHLLMWRGDDFLKDEGDPNYQSVRRDGTRWRGIRDYAETGVTRTFALAAGAILEASFRYHRIEDHYEYSYRVLARVRVAGRIR
jgi:hypothetical protein